MKRILILAAACAMLAPSSAQATGTKAFDFCGGSYSGYTGFAFCASVIVSVAPSTYPGAAVGAYTVTIEVANKSGLSGSYAGSLFAQIGLDNLINDLATPTNVTVSQNGSYVCTNVADNTSGKAKCWNVQEQRKAAGGVRLDFLMQTSSGVNLSVASACTGTENRLYTCLAAAPVRITFDVTTNFDPNNGLQVYVKGQGAMGSTECLTNSGTAIQCVNTPPVPPPTAVPEPATLVLLGSGLVGFVPAALRRRRQQRSSARGSV